MANIRSAQKTDASRQRILDEISQQAEKILRKFEDAIKDVYLEDKTTQQKRPTFPRVRIFDFDLKEIDKRLRQEFQEASESFWDRGAPLPDELVKPKK